MADQKNIHENHRQRVQQKVRETGFEGMADHEVLEYLLYFSIPRIDTNPIAHNLLNHFGSFSQVMEADENELAQVKGMGPASARLLHAMLLADKRYQMDRRRARRKMMTPEDFMQFVKPLFHGERHEQVYAVIINDKYELVRCVRLDDGQPNRVDIPTTKLVKEIMLSGGTGVVLAHNHPSGVAVPSQQDITATGKVTHLLGMLGIALIDHVVVAEDGACSMQRRGVMPVYDPVRGEVEYPF